MKILFIAVNEPLTEKKNGGSVITKRNYDALCTLYGKENVELIIPDYGKNRDNAENIHYFKVDISCRKRIMKLFRAKQYCAKYSTGSYRKIMNRLKEKQYDILWVDGSQFAGELTSFTLKNSDTEICLFMHNLEHTLYLQSEKKYEIWKKPIAYWVRKNEKLSIQNAKYIISLNERDNLELWRQYHRESDMIFPITVKDQWNPVFRKACGDYFLFVGSYFFPNVEGIRWLKKHVMPYVKHRLLVIGKGMERIKEELEHCGNIEVLGTVDNIADYYYSAIAVVEPIFSGSGMKVKTAEAMMYGKNIIASPEALTGYHLDNIEGIFECETPNDFINAMEKTAETRCAYNMTVRHIYEKYYVAEVYLPKLKKLLEN